MVCGGSSGCEGSSSNLSPKQAWKLVLQREQQLPIFHPLLFEQLGLSQRLLAWLAACPSGRAILYKIHNYFDFVSITVMCKYQLQAVLVPTKCQCSAV
jgi:hypothetical protein